MHNPNVFVEIFKSEQNQNGTVYCGFSQKKAKLDIQCVCNDPYNCCCKMHTPPQLPFDVMDKKLFEHPKPFLMFTIQRGNDSLSRFSFFCKEEHEVQKEIFRLNSKSKSSILWKHTEEVLYNKAVLSEYQLFLEQTTQIL